jgi:ribonuclease P protein subunit POP4
LPLHYLHILYLASLISLPPLPTPLPDPLPALPPGVSFEGIASKLSKADFTGISVQVLASRNPSLNGIRGIVIEETGATFRLVGEDGKIKVVPKEGTQFGLSFPAYAPLQSNDHEPVDVEAHLRVSPRIELTMLGTNFGFRSGDRAGRRFRLAQGEGGGNGWGEEWVRAEWDDVFGSASTVDETAEQEGTPKAASRLNGRKVEKGLGGAGMRKKGKSRRKDPFAGGCREVMF